MEEELRDIIRKITDAARGYGIQAFPAPETRKKKSSAQNGECSVTGAIYKNIETLVIPDNLGGFPVTRISHRAFERCVWLESAEIPDGIKSIGRFAFRGCKRLKRVTIGEGATSIFDGAFENCTALESVTLGDGIKTVFKNAFRGCTALKEVVVPDEAIIEDGAFPEGCKIIRRSEFAAQQPEEAAAEPQAESPADVTEQQAETLAETPAAEQQLEAVADVPADVAVETATKTVTEDKGTTKITRKEKIKATWQKLTNVFRNNYGEIDDNFNDDDDFNYYDDDKEEGYQPEEMLVENSTGLLFELIDYNGKNSDYMRKFLPRYNVIGTVAPYTDISLVIPDTYDGVHIVGISEGAFENCTALESVTLGDGIKTVFKNAFRGCTALKEVVVPDKAIIEDGAFPEGCKIIRRSELAAQQPEEAAAEPQAESSADVAEQQAEALAETPAVGQQLEAAADVPADVAVETAAESAQEEIKNAPAELTFAEQVDAVLNDQWRYGDLKVCDTPQILLDVGCEQLPMFYTQRHLKDALKPKNAEIHHHGLTTEQIKKLPEEIANPVMVLDAPNNDKYLRLILSDFDEDKSPLMAVVKPNGQGNYSFEIQSSNFLLSVYGKDYFFDYIDTSINEDKFLFYNKKRSEELFSVLGRKLPSGFNNLASDTIIRQSSAFVNSNEQNNPENISETDGSAAAETVTEDKGATEMTREEKITALDVQKLAEAYRNNYSEIYDNEENYTPEQRERYSQAVTDFDDMRKNPEISEVINNVQNVIGDWITSDREAAAFTFAVENLLAAETPDAPREEEPQENTAAAPIDYKAEVLKSVEQEYKAFQENLLKESPDAIFHRNFEIHVKTALKDYFTAQNKDDSDLSPQYFKALYSEKGHILYSLYDEFLSNEDAGVENSEEIQQFLEGYCEYFHSAIVYEEINEETEEKTEEVNTMTEEKTYTPIYYKNAREAYKNGSDSEEANAYRESDQATKALLRDFKKAINDNSQSKGYGVSVNTDTVAKQLTDKYGFDRVKYVLATIIQGRGWDERFTRENKDWAETIQVSESEAVRNSIYTDVHPTVVNSFTDTVKKLELEAELISAEANTPKAETADDKYLTETAAGYKVVDITKDKYDRNVAVVQRDNDFIVAVDYDTDEGTWAQGYYDFTSYDEANKFRNGDNTAATESREQQLLNEYGKNMSPMYYDYLTLAAAHPDVIVALHVGDFYEVFDSNAEKLAEQLELTLTGRDCGLPERVPMVGFPYFAAEDYVNQLAEQGVKMVLSDRLAENTADVAENAETGEPEIVTMYEVHTFTVTTPDGKAETAEEYYKQGKNITQRGYYDMSESESIAREIYDKLYTNVERTVEDGNVVYKHMGTALLSNEYELDEDGEITGAIDPDAGKEIAHYMPSYAETVRKEEAALEDAKQNARAIATAEEKPFVVINYSEHSAFKTGDIMSLVAAENKFTALNAEAKKAKAEGGFEGYYKTGFDIYYLDPKYNAIAGYTGGRFDIGDETDGIVEHIRENIKSTFLTESEKNRCMEFVNYLEGVLRETAAPDVQQPATAEAPADVEPEAPKAEEKSTKENITERVTPQSQSQPAEASDYVPEAKTKTAAENIRDEMVTALLQSMKNNPEKWEKGWIAPTTAPENGSTHKTYRGINNLYLSLVADDKGYKDNRWVTFDQARKMKASVKKGEKSAPIIYYSQYDRKTKKEFTEATVKGMTAEEREEYIQKNVHSVLKYSRVFNAEQCLNFPEKPPLPEMDEQERARQNAKIENIIKNSAAPVNYDGGNRAYYAPYEDAIHLPEIKTFKSMQDYYATALHEIAHSTGHESRLNRDLKSGEFGDQNYAQEELRAELASVFLQAQTGIKLEGSHIDNHGAYLSSWLKTADESGGTKKFYSAVTDAQKISDYIIANYLKESEIADITPQEQPQEAAAQQPEAPADVPADVAAETPAERSADVAAEAPRAEEKSTEEKVTDAAQVTDNGDKMKTALETFINSDLEENGKLSETTLEAIAMQGYEYVDGKLVKSQPKQTTEMPATAPELPSERENTPAADGNPTEPSQNATGWKRIQINEDQIGKEYGERVMLRMPSDGEYKKYVAFVPKKLIKKSEKTGAVYLSVNYGFNYTLNNDGMQVNLDGEKFAAALQGKEVNVEGERVAPSRVNARRIENIEKNAPDEMKQSPNWGVFYVKWNDEKKKYDKITVSAVTGERIKANDPATWATFEDAKEYALKNNCAGMTYVLDGSMTCIDLDHQLNKETGELSETAKTLVGELQGTYMERSVSGDGLHIFMKGDVLEGGKYHNKKKLENGDEIEIYDRHIMSMTGDLIEGAGQQVNVCPSATAMRLHKQLERYQPNSTAATSAPTSQKPQARSYQRNTRRTAAEVEAMILKTKNGSEYADLRAGKLIKGDHSADDFRFLTIVGYYSDNDRDIMRDLFTNSGLYRPEKGEDYLNRSIDNAIKAKDRTLKDWIAQNRGQKKSAKKGAHP